MAKLLALTSRVCYPPREGHQLRTWHLLRALAREHEIHLLSFARSDDDIENIGPLRETVAALELFPIPAEHSRLMLLRALLAGALGGRPFVVEKYTSASMYARVAALAPDVDLIHVDMLPLMGAVDAAAPRAPVVLNAHNVEHVLLQQRSLTEAHTARRLFLRSQTQKLRRFEVAACARADRVLACSTVDAKQLAELAPHTPISVIANGVDTQLNRPATQASQNAARLVFVGQMSWFPNADGVRWFLDDVFPCILAARSDAQFVLIGKSQGIEIPQKVSAHVRLAGFVDDVRAEVLDAAIYLVPLRAGSGTRLKVLEAMALGMPIVTTHIGAEGISLQHERDALFADTAEDFAAAVLRLIDAPAFAAQLGRAAREVAVASYDWYGIGDELNAIYSSLADSARAIR